MSKWIREHTRTWDIGVKLSSIFRSISVSIGEPRVCIMYRINLAIILVLLLLLSHYYDAPSHHLLIIVNILYPFFIKPWLVIQIIWYKWQFHTNLFQVSHITFFTISVLPHILLFLKKLIEMKLKPRAQWWIGEKSDSSIMVICVHVYDSKCICLGLAVWVEMDVSVSVRDFTCLVIGL